MDENVTIQFVPIAKDPLSEAEGETSGLIDSLFVVRLIVRPTRRTVQYSYSHLG